jgi:predicted N-formylglutamate amidohydrolase
MPSLLAIPDVCDVTHVRGRAAAPDAVPDLLVEVPHGATLAAHFAAVRGRLRGSYPDDLQDFFFVNTDVGAPEAALALAERLVAAEPRKSAVVLRCLIPRTFVDCNRIIDAAAEPKASAAGEMTPGLHVYVRDAHDRRLLLELYAAYRALVTAAFAEVCGQGGLGLMLHSYAPRSIDVPVDERVVERLRREYEPDRIEAWPLRAEVDLIANDPDGKPMASPDLMAGVRAELSTAGYQVEVNATYALHPVTLAHAFAGQHPASTLCLEVRRDLLVREFTPFAEMNADPDKVERAAKALAAGVAGALAAAARRGQP